MFFKKKYYSLEEVAEYLGITKQTLCNWLGCNSLYKSKKSKIRLGFASFLFFHLFKKKRFEKIRKIVNTLEKRYREDNDIKELKKELIEIVNLLKFLEKKEKEKENK